MREGSSLVIFARTEVALTVSMLPLRNSISPSVCMRRSMCLGAMSVDSSTRDTNGDFHVSHALHECVKRFVDDRNFAKDVFG